MKKKLFLLALATIVSTSAWARRPPVPLLPLREGASAGEVTQPRVKHKPSSKEALTVGFELGTLGRQSDSGSVLGMEVFFGGRATMRLFVFERFSLRPSLGYFRGAQSTGSLTTTQNLFEAGLNAQYAIINGTRTRWFAGLSQRLDASITNISVYDASENTPISFRYRVGPATGIATRMTENTDLTFDLEYTLGITKPTRQFGSLTVGFLFKI